jgi:hypothetical protein
VKAHIKVLRGVTIICQQDSCELLASYLIRTGNKIVAYCESHALAEADRIGIQLPDDYRTC